MVLGPAGAGAPAEQHPALSRRGGVVRLRPYHQPLVSPDVPPDRHAADALRRAGGAGAAGWPPLGSDRPADGPLLSRMAPAPRYSSLNA